jgi:hypothetical protein
MSPAVRLTLDERRAVSKIVRIAIRYERMELDSGLITAACVAPAEYSVFHSLVERGAFGRMTLNEVAAALDLGDTDTLRRAA